MRNIEESDASEDIALTTTIQVWPIFSGSHRPEINIWAWHPPRSAVPRQILPAREPQRNSESTSFPVNTAHETRRNYPIASAHYIVTMVMKHSIMIWIASWQPRRRRKLTRICLSLLFIVPTFKKLPLLSASTGDCEPSERTIQSLC